MSDDQFALYSTRRAALINKMATGVAIIPSANEVSRNADTHYPYRFDSDFYYLTGFSEPDAVLVLIAGAEPRSILFCREKILEREIWEGFHYGPEAAQHCFGVDAAFSLSALETEILAILSNQAALFYPLGKQVAWDTKVLTWVNTLAAGARRGLSAPEKLMDIRPLIAEMRLFKDAYERECMQTAATISARGHIRAMQAAGAGVAEYALEAELLYAFTQQGSRSPAYPSIVAGGENACVLHYVQNNARLRAGDLCLIDAGCEWQGYAADITRTFPVNGVFSGIQKTLYEIVLAAQLAAIAAVRIGNTWNDPHLAALGVLAQGLIDLGVCQGSVDGVIESGAYQPYYMHRTGHWLGLDVHDVGAYKQDGAWRALQENMVLTVEPGLYFRAAEGLPIALHGMGIRIEDDVLVQQNTAFILTHATPKTVAEIEEVMRAA